MKDDGTKVFLTAEWKHLAMLNYEIEPTVLAPFVPAGTELDLWDGRNLVSVVGFLFVKTRVFGIPIPFHRNFEEVNLRIYVRRRAGGGWRRGVVFIKEIVPRGVIALAARKLYNEPYVALPMAHRIEGGFGSIRLAEYSWRSGDRLNSLKVAIRGEAKPMTEGTETEFIMEHYWGYNAQPDGSTLEYRVEHPRWRVYDVSEAELHCDVGGLYGEQFSASLNSQPSSAFFAEGSAVCLPRRATDAMSFETSPHQPLGWILYDDSCGFCRRWIPFWETALQRRGFSIAPLQADWVRAKFQLSESQLLHDLRMLLADGSQIRGADVYRYATRRIWWAWPVYHFSITPGLQRLFDWGYRTFAGNRFRISSACGLDVKS